MTLEQCTQIAWICTPVLLIAIFVYGRVLEARRLEQRIRDADAARLALPYMELFWSMLRARTAGDDRTVVPINRAIFSRLLDEMITAPKVHKTLEAWRVYIDGQLGSPEAT